MEVVKKERSDIMREADVKTLRQILNIVAFVSTVVINILANTIPIAGKTTGELSDLYPNLFVPAGITFSIWGVIYILLALFVIYQAKDLVKLKKDPIVDQIGWWFIVTSVANIAWIFAWHYERIFLSLLIMLVLLVALLKIYLGLGIGETKVAGAKKYLVHLPFSIYLGWITVATIANVSALLVAVEWNRFGLSEVFWTALVIIIATVITLLMLKRRGDVFYVIVVIWAFIGIFIRHIAIGVPSYVLLLILIAAIALLTYNVVTRFRE
jgi:hypothetical protein